jgi:hypothetical protein
MERPDTSHLAAATQQARDLPKRVLYHQTARGVRLAHDGDLAGGDPEHPGLLRFGVGFSDAGMSKT